MAQPSFRCRWDESKIAEHLECHVQSCNASRVGGKESHLARASKRKTRGHSRVLDLSEIGALLQTLGYPYRQMVFLAAATGLRASELLALKWGDIIFGLLEISLNRSVVHQVIGHLKTEASRKPLPFDPDLAQSLLAWRRASPVD